MKVAYRGKAPEAMKVAYRGKAPEAMKVAYRGKAPEATKVVEQVYLFSLYVKRETAALVH
jgi:hypothetical protein